MVYRINQLNTEMEDKKMDVTESIRYIGTDDKTIDLFESQYVVPKGISYNSYLMIRQR